jgi:hypothetical protein
MALPQPAGLAIPAIADHLHHVRTRRIDNLDRSRPNGPADDPLVNYIGGQIVPGQNQNCPASAGPARYTESQPLSRERTYIGLGSVTVPNILAGTTAPFDARVWDVPPGPSQNQAGSPACRATPTPQGCPLLITRGTYRLDVPRTRTPQG